MGAGEHLCKVERHDADGDTNKGELAPDTPTDWPTTDWLKGPISCHLLSYGGWMCFGTERGYCYRIGALNDTTAGNDGGTVRWAGSRIACPELV